MKTASNEPTDARVSPEPILEAAWGFAVTRILTTGIELDVFTAIARGWTTLEDLAKETSCSARGLSMLVHYQVNRLAVGYARATVTATRATQSPNDPVWGRRNDDPLSALPPRNIGRPAALIFVIPPFRPGSAASHIVPVPKPPS